MTKVELNELNEKKMMKIFTKRTKNETFELKLICVFFFEPKKMFDPGGLEYGGNNINGTKMICFFLGYLKIT